MKSLSRAGEHDVQRRRAAVGIVWLAVGGLFAASAALLLGTWWVDYEPLRALLARSYGESATRRYFPPSVFASALVRVRVAALGLLGAAAATLVFRARLAAWTGRFGQALILSFRHAVRHRHTPDRWTIASLSVITLIGLCLRLSFISRPMRYDEATTVMRYASKPWYLALSIYNEPNNHLFHTLLVAVMTRLAGPEEWSVRVPALVAGAALPLLTFGFARRLASRNAALIAAALVSASSILVEYSVNARGYTLVCAMTLGLLILGWDTLRRASLARFVMFAATSVVGFWTIPVFLIPFVGVVAWMLWESLDGSTRLRRLFWIRLGWTCLAVVVGTTLVYVPAALVNGVRAITANSWVSPRDWQAFATGNRDAFALLWRLSLRDWPVVLSPLMAAGAAIALVRSEHLRRLAVSIVAWSAALFILRRFVPFARTWLMFIPILYTLAAVAFVDLLERTRVGRWVPWGPCVAAAAALALSILVIRQQTVFSSTETGVFRSARPVAAFLASHQAGADPVVAGDLASLPLEYYRWRIAGEPIRTTKIQELDPRTEREAWFLVDLSNSETLAKLTAGLGDRHALTLEEVTFDAARLYRVSWAQ